MGSYSLMHWIILLVVWAAWMIPLNAILKRIGWSRAWVLVAIFPPLAMVLLWCIAFGGWNTSSEG
ncbi:hypothetical protein K7W03_26880 [Sphingobium sp. PNB]|uniref:hypothetical protein n=1 Tax=Sphingobium sp. PNB TaxID=863934 RepID=UPI001CA3FA02|nr:hypothetical protein [Sphingobium sp. PNB]MCB4863202.1 hypothetical protein [Sphingobium sp. PNB]